MSTQINSYIVLGVSIKYDEFNKHIQPLCSNEFEAHETFVSPYYDSAFEIEAGSHDGLTVLYDGRDGEYVVIGEVLHKTPNHTWFESPVEVEFRELEERASKISEKIYEHFAIQRQSKIIVISHFR